MRNYLSYTSDPDPWPANPRGNPEGDEAADSQEASRAAAVAEVITVMADARRLVLVCGMLLAAGVVGAAFAVSVLVGRGGFVSLGLVGLLAPVILCWLVAVLLMMMAEQPAADALGELRRATGAPIDPFAPWQSLGVRPLGDSDVEWDRVVQLIGIANFQHSRARLALSWSVLAAAGCLLWVALVLAAATVF